MLRWRTRRVVFLALCVLVRVGGDVRGGDDGGVCGGGLFLLTVALGETPCM